MGENSLLVAICSWGSGKDARIDMERLREYASGLDGVAKAIIVDRACSKEGRERIAAEIRQSGADRFVAAACSKRRDGGMYRQIAVHAGISPLAFEVAAIREQAAYVHEPPEARGKAERIVLMAVEKLRLWKAPRLAPWNPPSRRVAVVGDGLTAALVLRRLGSLGLEAEPILIGDMRPPPPYIFAGQGQAGLGEEAMLSLRRSSPRAEGEATAIACRGLPGDFEIETTAGGAVSSRRFGAIVLAPEPRAELRSLDGTEVGDPRALLAAGSRRVVILPGGQSSGAGCSCITPRAVELAMSLVREAGVEVAILGREIRSLGSHEARQLEAQRMGVGFHRIESEPLVEGTGPWKVRWRDPLAGEVALEADLVLRDVVETPAAARLAEVFGLPLDEKGEMLWIDPRLRPGETVRRGVLATRYRLGNMMFEDIAAEAGAVAARAAELLQGHGDVGGKVAYVDQERCSACLGCVRACPYGAPRIGEAGKAEIPIELCQGCGTCLAMCPSRAIDIHGCSDAQLRAQIRVASGEGTR